jgi:hypothetical protein
MTPLDHELIERARAVNIQAVAVHHGARLRKAGGSEFAGPCPLCGGRDRFSVNVRKNIWNCRGCSKGGDVIDLVRHLDGCGFAEAVARLTGEDWPKPEHAGETKQQRNARDAAAIAERIEKARWLWSQRQTPQNTIVESYLRARGYRGRIPATIGFLPGRGQHHPSMIAAYGLPVEQDGDLVAPHTDEVRAVHLTRLLPDGSDRRRDKDERGRETNNKITIGPPLGFPIAIAPIGDGLSLALTEGIEDALAYRAAGYAAWAAGSSVYVSALAARVPRYVVTLIIEQHPDPQAAAAVADLCAALPPIEIIIREAVA